MDVTALPFNRLVGIVRSEKDGGGLTLPADVRYTNHLGTVHAGALLALAEAASGEFMLKEFAGLGFEVLPVVRRLEAKFRKPAHGAIVASVRMTPDQRNDFVATLTTKGRALAELDVDVHDESGTHALAAKIEWFVARKEMPATLAV